MPGARDSWPGWFCRVVLWLVLVGVPVVLGLGVDIIVDNPGWTAVVVVIIGYGVWEWVFRHETFWEPDGE